MNKQTETRENWNIEQFYNDMDRLRNNTHGYFQGRYNINNHKELFDTRFKDIEILKTIKSVDDVDMIDCECDIEDDINIWVKGVEHHINLVEAKNFMDKRDSWYPTCENFKKHNNKVMLIVNEYIKGFSEKYADKQ